MVCAIGNSAVIDETATGVDNGFAPTGAGYKLFDKSEFAGFRSYGAWLRSEKSKLRSVEARSLLEAIEKNNCPLSIVHRPFTFRSPLSTCIA